MTSLILYFYALLTLVQMCSSLKLDKGPKQKFKSNQIADESTNKPSILLPFKKIKDITATIVKSNPIGILASNIYDFFYWLPRRNILYDQPPVFWRNSTAQYIQWYQVPHNLPPYRYLDNDWPDDFFCYGLPGNTLPLGDWDPFGFQLVSKKVVFKYRESELKHGRLSMLAFVGMLLQEEFHPWHNDIGGLAITQMDRLLESPVSESIFYKLIVPILTFLPESIQRTIENTVGDTYIPIDYAAVVLFLISFEATALYRNWGRWKLNEFNHQFDHNIGIGNLKEDYSNGDYGWDVLKLLPEDDPVEMKNIELNHGRLAMVAVMGVLGQEYATGVSIMQGLLQWIESALANPEDLPPIDGIF